MFDVHTPEVNYQEFHKLPGGANPGHSAEAITEWPSGQYKGHPTGLASFSTVTYNGLSYGYLSGVKPFATTPGSVDQHRLNLVLPAHAKPHKPVTVISTSPSRRTAPPGVFTTFTTTYTGHW
jgi:hypothetical protein